jgi:hypothetical protein
MARGYRPGGRTYVSGFATVKSTVQESEVYDPSPLRGVPRNGILLVDASKPKCPKWMHRQMNLRAVQFKKELNLTYTPWVYLNHGAGQKTVESDGYARGYLFGDHHKRIVGACAFRFREGHWRLHWVWFNREGWQLGHLKAAWDYFRKQYGDFRIDTEVTDAMKDFLHKNTLNQF